MTIAECSVLNIPPLYFTAPAEKIPLQFLLPRNIYSVTRGQKPALQYGCPSKKNIHVNAVIESIPPDLRIEVLKSFQDKFKRTSLLPIPDSWYHQYVLSSLFIDIRLLRLLLRIATNRVEPDETGLTSACAIRKFLRKKFPNEKEFDYLTPDYIMDWYNILGGYQFDLSILSQFAPQLRDHEIDKSNRNHYPLIQISISRWKRCFLNPRIELISITGYETTR